MYKKIIALVFASAAMLVFVSGCAKSPEQKFADLMTDYANIIVDNADDCSAAAQKLNKFVDAHGEEVGKLFVEVMNNAKDGKTDQKVKTDPFNGLTEEKQAKVKEIAAKCMADKDFMEANNKFGEIMLKAMMGGIGDALKDAFKDEDKK